MSEQNNSVWVKPDQPMMWYYLGIGTISAASLLMEVTMTRIFAVAFFNQFAFLIISTALFGFGFSGVFLSIFKGLTKYSFERVLMYSSICFTLTLVLTLKIVVSIPLQFKHLGNDFIQFLYLSIYYISLAVPFFFSGIVIALLLSNFPIKVNKLYFSDLIGAGIGCFLIIPLVPAFGASATIIIASLLGILAAACFARMINKHMLAVCVVISLGLLALLPFSETYFRVKIHEGKRSFNFDEQYGLIEFSRWGPISRIDVADLGNAKNIWIDGGTNQSFMLPFDGDLRKLNPHPQAGLVYQLIDFPDVLIIGPAGGTEVLFALSHRPNSILGVELDPVIVSLVQNEYRDYIGGIYNKPMVTLVNDEGRSYVRRITQKFDIIQQIHNASPVAIASGAVNLSETYLLTVEAFHDYLDHLKENGYIYIKRPGAIRLAVIAAQALRERGINNPEDRMIILFQPANEIERVSGGEFYLKNGEFTQDELDFFKIQKRNIMHAPSAMNVHNKIIEKYRPLIKNPDGWKVYDRLGISMFPVTDDRPFFNHFSKFAHFASLEKTPFELESFMRYYHSPDFSLLIILGEAALLSVIFILLPLSIFKRSGLNTPGKIRFLLYFFSLGLGFILIEIVLIQKFILFIGNPSYSVSVVLFSILIAAGCGSYVSERFQTKLRVALPAVVLTICLLCLLELLFTPAIFNFFLGYNMAVRIVISILLIFPLGLVMGMPFPIGITIVDRISKPLIPWVWAINGYATVIGSVLCTILALNFGFRAVVVIACTIYLVGFTALFSLNRLFQKNA
ncbi:hypothetical protein JXQ70_03165 [bacterium]|nr:hypothetical protein [bacterium]